MKRLDRAQITPEVLGKALRRLRVSRGLTQRDLAKRSDPQGDPNLGRLLESQVSDFERGRAMPSMKSLFNLLTGCCGSVDLRALQRSLEQVCAVEAGGLVEEADELTGAITERIESLGERVTMVLSERLDARLDEQLQQSRDEVAELRTRLVKTERVLASLSGSMSHASPETGHARA